MLICCSPFADLVSSTNAKTHMDHLHVELGSSLILNCTYNCSSGFIRGCWSKNSNTPGCLGTISRGSFCTVSLGLSHVSAEDVEKNYTCYTIDTDEPSLPKSTVQIVFLQVQGNKCLNIQKQCHICSLKQFVQEVGSKLLLCFIAQKKFPNWTITPKTGPKTGTNIIPL